MGNDQAASLVAPTNVPYRATPFLGAAEVKRTAWNSTLPAPSKPMAPGKPMKRGGRIRCKGKPRHAVSGKRDEPYREYIRSLPCLVAGKPGHICRGITECAHVRSKGAGGADRGNTIPLCSRAHGEQHAMGIRSFAAATGLDLAGEAARLEAAYVLRDFGVRAPVRSGTQTRGPVDG